MPPILTEEPPAPDNESDEEQEMVEIEDNDTAEEDMDANSIDSNFDESQGKCYKKEIT